VYQQVWQSTKYSLKIMQSARVVGTVALLSFATCQRLQSIVVRRSLKVNFLLKLFACCSLQAKSIEVLSIKESSCENIGYPA
jgi:hypothetical protein